ncbi:Wall-associated protein precursor [Melittangium boletus]|uniref:Wall-associated protein n=1 Tax=Melittangium boletus DSM 14713 TaxID=1294270 RepID=A0A250I808_9BACT|nr:Wall-associated protein precursor [Melittangium boletus]ATB28009.1 Wall-associated protein precursor [Melittangium boletus DSM 14713]
MLSILLLLLTQVPCAPNDLSLVCHCKQGMVSSCAVLRETDPKLADAVDKALTLARVAEEVGKAGEAIEAEAQASSDEPEPPDCKGQNHHVISRPIAKELDQHITLRGLYTARDPRFVTRAVDEPSHCGYQSWHREVDKEVISWLRRYRQATPKQFEAFLREIYSRPSMRVRFPRGF